MIVILTLYNFTNSMIGRANDSNSSHLVTSNTDSRPINWVTDRRREHVRHLSHQRISLSAVHLTCLHDWVQCWRWSWYTSTSFSYQQHSRLLHMSKHILSHITQTDSVYLWSVCTAGLNRLTHAQGDKNTCTQLASRRNPKNKRMHNNWCATKKKAIGFL
jgi:hypothetical protein